MPADLVCLRAFAERMTRHPQQTTLSGQPKTLRPRADSITRFGESCRTGVIPFVFDDGFGFERYIDYVLDVPMLFVCR